MSNSTVPVIAGLAVGIAFVVLFASIFGNQTHPLFTGHFLNIEIEGLKEKYKVDESIDFTVKANGFSQLCGYPMLKIVEDSETGKVVYQAGTFWLGGGCDPDFRDIDETWTLKQMGVTDDIDIKQKGNYNVVIEYGNMTVEKEFSVV